MRCIPTRRAPRRLFKLTHAPIPEIGWQTMTMEFLVAPSVDLRSLRPNRRINFIMEQSPEGMYDIQAIAPTESGQ
jgi:Cu/Ag efflux protein CusF